MFTLTSTMEQFEKLKNNTATPVGGIPLPTMAKPSPSTLAQKNAHLKRQTQSLESQILKTSTQLAKQREHDGELSPMGVSSASSSTTSTTDESENFEEDEEDDDLTASGKMNVEQEEEDEGSESIGEEDSIDVLEEEALLQSKSKKRKLDQAVGLKMPRFDDKQAIRKMMLNEEKKMLESDKTEKIRQLTNLIHVDIKNRGEQIQLYQQARAEAEKSFEEKRKELEKMHLFVVDQDKLKREIDEKERLYKSTNELLQKKQADLADYQKQLDQKAKEIEEKNLELTRRLEEVERREKALIQTPQTVQPSQPPKPQPYAQKAQLQSPPSPSNAVAEMFQDMVRNNLNNVTEYEFHTAVSGPVREKLAYYAALKGPVKSTSLSNKNYLMMEIINSENKEILLQLILSKHLFPPSPGPK